MSEQGTVGNVPEQGKVPEQDAALARTAKMTAAARALESRRPDRLFEDPLASALAGTTGFELMERWRLPGAPVENPSLGPRTRFFDELVLAAVADGIDQIVLLAAGMDARAFRLALGRDTVVFELDQRELLDEKRRILDRGGAAPRCRRIAVPADLAAKDWPQALLDAGLDGSSPSVFVLEALSWCLSEAVLVRVLDGAAELATAGSRLGIDVVSRDFLANPALLPLLALASAEGVYWQFGTNDPAALLAAHGWRAQVSSLAEVARGYGRWPPDGVTEDEAARAAAAMPEYLIVAARAASG